MVMRASCSTHTQPPQLPFANTPARLRIKWTRGGRVAVTPQDTTKIKVKSSLLPSTRTSFSLVYKYGGTVSRAIRVKSDAMNLKSDAVKGALHSRCVKKDDTHSSSSTSGASGNGCGSSVVRTQSARVPGPRIAFTAPSEKCAANAFRPAAAAASLSSASSSKPKLKYVCFKSGDGRRVLDQISANAPLAEAARSAA